MKIVAKFMKMRNHDHIKGEKGENLIISQDKKLHNSAKSWSFFKKLGSFELLMVWAARNWSYMLNLTHSRPFYEQITLCASYYIRICISYILKLLTLARVNGVAICYDSSHSEYE